ncbi:MAG: hypothetical protein MZW92_12270 [Comamonadaceae bacterium]|nr:hypothetical protein [Comamonadaceae bacterium]
MSDELFDDVARQAEGGTDLDGEARLETANRTQVELTPTDLESLLPPGHAARLVWRLRGGAGPLGLHGDAFGRAKGARAVRRSTRRFWWRCGCTRRSMAWAAPARLIGCATPMTRIGGCAGGVSVNYHTLSTFRVAHQAALDALLTQSITVLLDKQVVTLNRIAQDGTKIRASAGVRSVPARGAAAGLPPDGAAAGGAHEGGGRRGGAGARGRRRSGGRPPSDWRAWRRRWPHLPAVEATKQRNGSQSAAQRVDDGPGCARDEDGGWGLSARRTTCNLRRTSTARRWWAWRSPTRGPSSGSWCRCSTKCRPGRTGARARSSPMGGL